jgi:dipeptidyl aminopeptidase/acylaminoacyl peptidase
MYQRHLPPAPRTLIFPARFAALSPTRVIGMFSRLSLCVLATTSALVIHTASAQTADYHKADLIRTSGSYIMGTRVSPNWLDDSVRFWFKSTGRGDRGTVYIVDPRNASRRILFDNARMAAALSVAADTILDPSRFPSFTLTEVDKKIQVKTHKRTFECEIATYKCLEADTLALELKRVRERGPEWANRSPDKKWDLFLWRQNVYVRPANLAEGDVIAKQDSIKKDIEKKKQDSIRKSRGEKVDEPPKKANTDSIPLPSGSIQLTNDGEWLDTYAATLWQLVKEDKKAVPTAMYYGKWSPDSRRVVVQKAHIKGTRIYPMYSSTKDQPEDRSYYFSAPGDSIIQTQNIHILDIANRSNTMVKDTPTPIVVHGMTGISSIWWGRTSDKLYALNATRGSHRVRLNAIDPATGEVKQQIARDSNATFVELQPGGNGANVAIVNNGEDIIWFSERDGWGHLYRFDEQGKLKNQIESGAYSVENISKIDSVKKQVYFSRWGSEGAFPYYSKLYRVNFDGSGMTLLTPEEGDHSVSFVPKADYMIDTYSRVDREPVTVLRSAIDGRVIMELTRGDSELLRQIGWTPGEIFQVKARDGVTDIYGILYKPSTFDPTKKYPIITHIYPGPQTGSVSSWGFTSWGQETRALAELGFIVIELNHLGTPGRSKWFHDYYYGNMGDNGIPDHIAGIRQLAARYPWIDINKVGIYGASGGGFATADALFRHPDFFQVGIADAGNHHPATYGFFWAEKYQGLYNKASYDASANYTLAKNLKGKLLLMAGDLDSNVHPAATLKVVDALIKANKNFDMYLFPDEGHGAPDFGLKKSWDYFVTYLRGEKPPEDYEMLKFDWSSMFF